MTTKPFGPFRLPEDEIDAIRIQAQREKRSMTSLIRAAVDLYIRRRNYESDNDIPRREDDNELD